MTEIKISDFHSVVSYNNIYAKTENNNIGNGQNSTFKEGDALNNDTNSISHKQQDPINVHTSRCKKEEYSYEDIKTVVILFNQTLVHSCTVCGDTFKWKSKLKRHMQCHLHPIFTCDFCCKQFKRKEFLLTHKKSHFKDDFYRCDLCNKEFFDRSTLQRHKRIHTGVKKFMCNICSKKFDRKDILTRHIRIHSKEEKKFTCVVCSKQFRRKYELKQHAKIHSM